MPDRDALILSARRLAKTIGRCIAANHHVDRDDAEQEAMLALIHAADRYESGRGAPFAAFARVVVRRHVTAWARREQGILAQTTDHIPNRIDPAPNAETCLITDETLDAIWDELTGKEQRVVLDRADGGTHQQIADRTGTTRRQVKRILSRIRKKARTT